MTTKIPRVTKRSFALISTSDVVDTIAVFVHGFGGDPDKTWRRFPSLIRSDPTWATTDVYFFGYASVDDEITLSADYLHSFVSHLAPVPPPAVFSISASKFNRDVRTQSGRYDRLRLIGHSEGGVLIRAAILESVKRRLSAPQAADPVDDLFADANVALFAPAIGGARVSGHLGRVLNTLGIHAAARVITGGSPAFHELEPTSTLLTSLRADTTYFADVTTMSALRAKIVWAHRDGIVSSVPYRHDVSWRSLNTSHSTVCKPSSPQTACYELATLGIPSTGVL